MGKDRDSMREIDGGPSFDKDSITIPEELRKTSNFGNKPSFRPVSMGGPKTKSWALWLCLIVGSGILGIALALLLKNGDSHPSSTPSTAAPEPSINPPETEVTAKGKQALALAPMAKRSRSKTDKTMVLPSATVPSNTVPSKVDTKIEVPKPVAVNPVKKRRRRRKPQRSLDDALAKLQDIEEESDLTESVDSMKFGDTTSQGTIVLAPDAACAQGDVSACIKAGRAAELGTDGAKARQFYGIACAKGAAAACGYLASLLERGIGGAFDQKRAHSLRGKACKLGHVKSCPSVKTTTSSTH